MVETTRAEMIGMDAPSTIAGLEDRLERLFWCVVGPPLAYFEIPLEGTCDVHGGVARFQYVSLVFKCTNEKQGVEQLWPAFKQAAEDLKCEDGDRPLLIWRRRPVLEGGAIRCRVVIPGANLKPFERKEGGQ